MCTNNNDLDSKDDSAEPEIKNPLQDSLLLKERLDFS